MCCILVFACCVSCESVLALGCCESWGVAGSEGRAPSLMTAADPISLKNPKIKNLVSRH
jgi:hypothetical protein